MNHILVLKLIGNVMKYEALLMLPSLLVSYIYGGSDAYCFYAAIALLSISSFLLSFLKTEDTRFRNREGFAAVALSWLVLSFSGAIPFYISGYFTGFIDCLFESISGFTTTGATILKNIEGLPRGILFWRCFSHWIGGMGVLMFMLAIMPSLGASTVSLLKAESPGPAPGKIVPKLKEMAKIMYTIYFVMTAIQVILLMLSGLPAYDSLIHAFSSAGTGGFSNMNTSIGAYNNLAVEIIITIFMFLFGINFTLYFYVLRKDFKSVFKDEELRFYLFIVLTAILLITTNLTSFYGSVSEALRHASFQVSSIITTTGFSTTDFNQWPAFSKVILVILMLFGACAGSTSGGIKLVRIIILLKAVKSEINKIIRPRIVNPPRLNGRIIESDAISKIAIFVFIYFAILVTALLIISLENKSMLTNITAVIAAISNTGIGLELIGPMGNYSSFNSFSKLVLSFCMLAGRLEFLPLLVIFAPSLWRKSTA